MGREINRKHYFFYSLQGNAPPLCANTGRKHHSMQYRAIESLVEISLKNRPFAFNRPTAFGGWVENCPMLYLFEDLLGPMFALTRSSLVKAMLPCTGADMTFRPQSGPKGELFVLGHSRANLDSTVRAGTVVFSVIQFVCQLAQITENISRSIVKDFVVDV